MYGSPIVNPKCSLGVGIDWARRQMGKIAICMTSRKIFFMDWNSYKDSIYRFELGNESKNNPHQEILQDRKNVAQKQGEYPPENKRNPCSFHKTTSGKRTFPDPKNFIRKTWFSKADLPSKSLLLFTDPFHLYLSRSLDSYVRGKNLCRLQQYRFGTKNCQKLW
jgi:hypothetical protein